MNKKIKRIIFIDKNGISRAPMAAALLESLWDRVDIQVLVRGIIVQFPEPLNPKVEAVLISNEISLEDFSSLKLEEADITDNTICFTMDDKLKDYIIEKYDSLNESNTFMLSTFVDEELEIIDPYGGSLQAYGICFESMKAIIQKLIEKIEREDL